MEVPSRPHTPPSTSCLPSTERAERSPRPDADMNHDFDDLLEGLGPDDLDDFELDGNALDEEDSTPFEAAPRANDLFNPRLPASNAGFTTGRGIALPPPSVTALDRARKLLEETEEQSQETTTKRRRLDGASSNPVPPGEPAYVTAHLARVSMPSYVTSPTTPHLAGFSTGGMKPIAPPSEKSRRKALALLGEDILDHGAISPPSSLHGSDLKSPNRYLSSRDSLGRLDFGSSQGLSSDQGVPFDPVSDLDLSDNVDDRVPGFPQAVSGRSAGFTSGNGRPLPPPKRESLQKVAQFFQDDADDAAPAAPPILSAMSTAEYSADLHPTSENDAAAANASSAVFTLASGAPAPTSNASREKALALFNDTPSRPIAPASRSVALSILGEAESEISSTPSRPTFRPPSSTSQFRSPLHTASRTPLRTHAKDSAGPSVLKTNDVNVVKRPIEIKTPTAKLLGTGRTPVSSRRPSKKFVTPFKTPQMSRKTSMAQPTPVRAPTPIQDEPVFDITMPSGRQSMREAHLKPHYHEIAELSEMGLPDEIWQLDLTNARFYQFIDERGLSLGAQAALQVLVQDGARLAKLPWVENHWGMILWKIAGLIRAEPALFDKRWNWDEVIGQLKYRYEREYGAAQRPIIRRIQEQDSASGVPMVLCVSAIHRPEPQSDQHGKVVAVKPFLELTDGWYRINAEIDECLVRAVNKGVIVIGRKISICGARLESAGEPTEVLDALHKSRIIISGNSTSLARWDARLGAAEPFVASLRSLSPDGGFISLMAVTVEKVFPLAFCHANKSAAIEQPWDESEEAIRAGKWKDTYESESTRLRDEMRASLASLEELANLLMSNAQDAESTQDTPPDDIDVDFDQLLVSKSPSTLLRGMSDTKIIYLARHAQSRMEAEMNDAGRDLQHQLQTACPPRQIRDFRIVRLVDAIEGEKGHVRTALLTIWDASSVDIEEGRSYLVSNLMPGRQGDWNVPREGGAKKEIYLNSRRDSRWQVFDRSAAE